MRKFKKHCIICNRGIKKASEDKLCSECRWKEERKKTYKSTGYIKIVGNVKKSRKEKI